MNIFITGIAGFLGSHLADHHINRGDFVYGCDSLIGGDKDNIYKQPRSAFFHTEHGLACRLIWSIKDCEQLRGTDIPSNIDVLYHCAALAYEGLSVFSPALISQNIYGASAAVFSAAIQASVKRIVFCSSMARYGHIAPPFSEDVWMPETYRPDKREGHWVRRYTSPVDPYGVSKLAAERLLACLADAHGFEYVIAVPHNIIGPRQKYDDPYRNVASIMINRMLQGMPPIIYGDGEQKRCFSFVQDCVDSLVAMATAPVSGEVINIGPDQGEITINELAQICAELTGFKGDPVYLPPRPQEVREAWCSSDKARRLLGYQTKTGLRDGLQSIVDHIRLRGPKPFRHHLPVEIVNKRTPKVWLSPDHLGGLAGEPV